MLKPRSYLALAALLTLGGVAHAQPVPAPEDPEPGSDTAKEPPTAAKLEQRIAELMARPGGLTADDVAKRALQTSNETQVARARISAAEYERDQAVVGYVPRLTLTARYTRLSNIDAPSFGPDGGNLVATSAPAGPLAPGAPLTSVPASALSFPVILDQVMLQANLLVPVTDIALRVVQQHAAADASLDAARLEEQASERAVAANARIAYYGWARARMQQVVAEQTLAQNEAHVATAEALVEAARASRADVLAAEAQRARAVLLVERAHSGADAALDQLHTLMHDKKPRDYDIGEDIAAEATGAPLASLDDMHQEALRSRPELDILAQQTRALESRRRAATAGAIPRLDLFGNLYYANPNPRYVPQVAEFKASWDLGVQLSWTPNDVPSSLSSASSLDARVSELKAQRDQLYDAVRSEVREARRAVRDGRVALSTTRRALDAAEEAYRVRVERFKLGAASALALADAEAQLLTARLERIDAQVGLRVAEVRLQHALGRDLR